jgi:hypothetical protein
MHGTPLHVCVGHAGQVELKTGGRNGRVHDHVFRSLLACNTRMKRSKASACVSFTHLLPEHSDAYGEFFYSEYMSIRWDKTKFRRSRGLG